ncbi:MAG: Tim44 domain-containing protein [Alphaproteobacteria bacterium]|nr:Tim44 domain-containing protein [Alphaproteobacteria bacterium]
MDSFGGYEILFLALVAGFLVLRLRSVLGQKTGNEDPSRWRSTRAQPAPGKLPDNVTPLPGRPAPLDLPPGAPPPLPGTADAAAPANALDAGIAQIRAADPSFDPRGFVAGAKSAFEMIVQAFAQGDTATLRPLLSDDVYENFAGAIRERQRLRHTLETTLVAMRSAEIVEARMNGRTAEVSVKFVSEQANVTRDESGQVLDGAPNAVATVTDIWTFARNTRASDPNWALVGTTAQT